MNRKHIQKPALRRILLSLGLCLPIPLALAGDGTPGDFRHLDWISKDEIATLPEAQRPTHMGMCSGIYLAPQPASSDTSGRVHATADRFNTTEEGHLLLDGHVAVHQNDRELSSDQVQLDRVNGTSELRGNVTIRQPGLLVRGSQAFVDSRNDKMDVRTAEYVAHAMHAHGRAGRIHNPAPKQLILDRATYTTCEPGDPTWLLSADRIKLDQASGWGQVRNATFEIQGVPVMYLPWWLFPIDDRRQSGFLFPTLGNNSESGISIGIPYYLNLAPNYDATITPTYIGRRGTLVESGFRYLTPHTSGTLGGGYLEDDRLENGENRSMVKWQHLGTYGSLRNEVDYTEVSDSYYFNDLGTTLGAPPDTHLDQRVSLVHYGNTTAGINLHQYQTIDEAIGINDLPYRRLPQLFADTLLPLSHEPLQVRAGSEYVYFEHPDQGDPGLLVADHADRVRLHSSIAYNYRGPWGFLVPRYTYRYRYYNIAGGPLDQQEPDLTVGLFNIDSGLYFDRPFRFLDRNFTQTLEPRVYYLYVPYVRQNHLPLFDTAKNSFGFEQLFRDNRFTGGDRIGDANQVSLGVTSRFIDQDTGLERLNLGLGQILYLRDREVQLRPQDPVEDTDISPLVARGLWLLNRHWSMRAETQYDSELNNIDSMVGSIGFRSKSGNLVNLGYNYYDDGALTGDPGLEKIKQTDFSFMWSITDRWGLLGHWVYDQDNSRTYDNMLGVEYESCCWRARLLNRRYLQESKDDPFAVEAVTGIYLQVELKGLGGLGGDVDRLLNESIPGYQERESTRPVRY